MESSCETCDVQVSASEIKREKNKLKEIIRQFVDYADIFLPEKYHMSICLHTQFSLNSFPIHLVLKINYRVKQQQLQATTPLINRFSIQNGFERSSRKIVYAVKLTCGIFW